MPRDEERGIQVGQRADGRSDGGLERGAAEVQPADQGVQPRHRGQPLRVPDDVDDAGVPAAGQHDETLAAQVHDESLVVEDQAVGQPFRAAPRLVGRGHTVLELGGPVHLR